MRALNVILPLLICLGAGCADDGSEIDLTSGGTWGSGEWELPSQVRKAFAKQQPGAKIVAWDRENPGGGESVYDIVYQTPGAESHSIRLSATGEVLKTPKSQTPPPVTEQAPRQPTTPARVTPAPATRAPETPAAIDIPTTDPATADPQPMPEIR